MTLWGKTKTEQRERWWKGDSNQLADVEIAIPELEESWHSEDVIRTQLPLWRLMEIADWIFARSDHEITLNSCGYEREDRGTATINTRDCLGVWACPTDPDSATWPGPEIKCWIPRNWYEYEFQRAFWRD